MHPKGHYFKVDDLCSALSGEEVLAPLNCAGTVKFRLYSPSKSENFCHVSEFAMTWPIKSAMAWNIQDYLVTNLVARNSLC
jgi:hypothetical protein